MSWQFDSSMGLEKSLDSGPIPPSADPILKSDTKSGPAARSTEEHAKLGQNNQLNAVTAIQRQQTDNEFLQEILQEHQRQKENNNNSTIFKPPRGHQDNSHVSSAPAFDKVGGNRAGHDDQLVATAVKLSQADAGGPQDVRRLPAVGMSTIFDQSNPIMEHILPSHNRQAASISWSNYSMPIYSSLGMDANRYSGDGEVTTVHKQQVNLDAMQSDVSPNTNRSTKASQGRRLMGRFGMSQLNNIDESNYIFSNMAAPNNAHQAEQCDTYALSRIKANPTRIVGGITANYQGDHHQLAPASSSSRSYSSVLNSQDLQNRLSMYSPLQLTSVPSDTNSMSYIGTQSSLIPTNLGQASGQQANYHQYHASQSRNPASTFIERPVTHLHQHQVGSSYHAPMTDTSQGQQAHILANGQTLPTSSHYFNSRANNFPVSKNFAASGTGDGAGVSFATNSKSNRRNRLPFFNSGSGDSNQSNPLRMNLYDSNVINSDGSERYSRKVFVGGLPPDIDEDEIKASFRRFGNLVVDWPHKAESKSYFPPKGYAFLLFHDESSVQALIDACVQENDKLYLCVSSPTTRDKPVQIRPWRLADADFVLDSTLALNPRRTVFVGGVPRPLKASELANLMNNCYGNVCYAGIDTDPELRYPKGAGRVAFSTHESYIAAINSRFVHLQHSEIDKRIEIKPYVLDDQTCDECQGAKCNNKFAPFFCAHIDCLNYFCESCWEVAHRVSGKEYHKPMVKEATDRQRGSNDRSERTGYKWV